MFSRKLIIGLTFLYLNGNECIKCHQDKWLKCKKDIHYTLENSISLILKAWGLEDYNKTLQELPEIKTDSNIKSQSDLAIDFLRRKCLRCHLESKEVNPSKNRCLACHNYHRDEKDSFKAKPKMKNCLKCHNGNFIGTDYLGMFPKDFDKSYRAPITKDGSYPKIVFRNSYHHLIEDIHYKNGMSCTDCHKMGKRVNCKSCHQDINRKNHPEYHSKISCIACHSSWQVNSYKSIILRDDSGRFYKEFKRLINSEDIYLSRFLKVALKSKDKEITPAMPDFINNKNYLGIWYLGYKFRRWERFFLVNYNGKIELARPLLDFKLTYIDSKGRTVIDAREFGGFTIIKPHTIIKEAKSCEMCHLNPLNLNIKDTVKFKTLKGALLEGKELNSTQIERLQSKKYKFIRAKEIFKK